MTQSTHHKPQGQLSAGLSRHRAGGLDERITSEPDERGITTAEYAVGTAAGAGLAGLLYQLLTSEFGEQLLRALFEHVLGLLGIG